MSDGERQSDGLGARFGALIDLSVLHAPLALLLAAASAVLWFCVFSALSSANPDPHGLARVWVPVAWLALSHALFCVFLCAWIGLPGVGFGRRLRAVGAAALRAWLPLSPVAAAALAAPLLTPLLAVAIWFAACFTAAPARLLDHGWRGWAMLARPLDVPAAHRAALLLPSLLFLGTMARLLEGAPFALMDGGVLSFPLLGVTLWWGFYSAALFSAAFAWPEVG